MFTSCRLLSTSCVCRQDLDFKFESISIIVSKKISKQSDIDELQQFFLGYGINMKGLLFEEKNNFEKKVEDIGTNKSDTVIVKKKWWQRIFSK